MRTHKKVQLIAKYVGITFMGLLTMVLVTACSFTNNSQQTNNLVGINAVTATVEATPALTPTPNPTIVGTVRPTVLVTVTPPGDLVPIPSAVISGNDIIMRRNNNSPTMSQQDAMQSVATLGVPWGLGGQFEGKNVTITAYNGLVTVGHAGINGEWFGPSNMPLRTCTGPGKCTLTGKVLDRIVDRPMWIIDYGNTIFRNSGTFGGSGKVNHSVYLVDEETKTVFLVWGYQGS